MGCCNTNEKSHTRSTDKDNDNRSVQIYNDLGDDKEKKESSWKIWLVLVIIALFILGYII